MTLDPHHIARDLLGAINWQDGSQGYCRCPGQHLHSHRNAARDCIVYLDKVPSIHCVHSSCSGVIEKANHDLRSAVAKGANNGQRYQPTAEDRQRQRKREADERLAQRAESSLQSILKRFACDPVELWESSPTRLLDDPRDDWRSLLSLFAPDDVVWIGQPDSSGQPKHVANFRTVAEWLTEPKAPDNFTVPSTFKPGTISRSNGNVVRQRYLVIESDVLTKPQIAAVFQWMRQFMTLRCVVDTGSRSLHGWYDFPDDNQLAELRVILPKLGCDPALFKASQPCRLPGAWRAEKRQWQALLYFSGGQQ